MFHLFTYFVSCEVNCFVNDAVGSFSESFKHFKPLVDFIFFNIYRFFLGAVVALSEAMMGNVLINYSKRLSWIVMAVILLVMYQIGGFSMLVMGIPILLHAILN